MQLKRILVYSLCAISIGAWYKEAKACCPYESYPYEYSSGNKSYDPCELCPSDSRWCPSKHNIYSQMPSIEKEQEAKVVALKNYIDNKKVEATKPVREVAQYDIRWQEEEPNKTITDYDLRAGRQRN